MSSKQLKKIPEIPFSFLLRRIFRLKKHLLKEIEFLHEVFGSVFGIQVDNLKCFIKRPDLIKQVLVDKHLHYEKGVGFVLFHNVVGFGLLTSDGDKWVKERKVLNFEFQRQNENTSFDIIREELERIQAKSFKKDQANFTQSVNELTVKTICRILFNYEVNDDIWKLRKWFHDYDYFFGKQQKSFIKFPLWVPLPYILRAKASIRGLRGFAQKVLAEKIKSDDMNMIKRMKEAGFDDQNICDHILTFFIAGHETTANSMNFTMLLLRDHPEYIEKLKQEVRGVEGEINKDSVGNLQYLDIIIKESLRLYPTIPLFPRIAKDDDTLGEYEIKKGDMIAFSPWIMHRSSEFWEDPLKFYPERFIDKKFEKDFIYFPFGGGPRKCIGAALSTLQMKEIFFYLFKQYDFDIQGPVTTHFTHNVSLAPKGDVMLTNIQHLA
jgi:cytochrome P450